MLQSQPRIKLQRDGCSAWIVCCLNESRLTSLLKYKRESARCLKRCFKEQHDRKYTMLLSFTASVRRVSDSKEFSHALSGLLFSFRVVSFFEKKKNTPYNLRHNQQFYSDFRTKVCLRWRVANKLLCNSDSYQSHVDIKLRQTQMTLKTFDRARKASFKYRHVKTIFRFYLRRT